MRQQDIRVLVPDDFEVPARLVEEALKHYLHREDRWRSVHVIALTADEPMPLRP